MPFPGRASCKIPNRGENKIAALFLPSYVKQEETTRFLLTFCLLSGNDKEKCSTQKGKYSLIVKKKKWLRGRKPSKISEHTKWPNCLIKRRWAFFVLRGSGRNTISVFIRFKINTVRLIVTGYGGQP